VEFAEILQNDDDVLLQNDDYKTSELRAVRMLLDFS
jgi:hypothetical protein